MNLCSVEGNALLGPLRSQLISDSEADAGRAILVLASPVQSQLGPQSFKFQHVKTKIGISTPARIPAFDQSICNGQAAKES